MALDFRVAVRFYLTSAAWMNDAGHAATGQAMQQRSKDESKPSSVVGSEASIDGYADCRWFAGMSGYRVVPVMDADAQLATEALGRIRVVAPEAGWSERPAGSPGLPRRRGLPRASLPGCSGARKEAS